MYEYLKIKHTGRVHNEVRGGSDCNVGSDPGLFASLNLTMIKMYKTDFMVY